MSDTSRTQKTWFGHHPTKARRHVNKAFRIIEKQYFLRFGEFLKKGKSSKWKTS